MNKFIEDVLTSNKPVAFVILGVALVLSQIFSEFVVHKLYGFFDLQVKQSFFGVKLYSCLLNISLMFFCYSAFLYFYKELNIFVEIYSYATSDYASVLLLLSFGGVVLLPILAFVSFMMYGLWVKFKK